VGGIKEKLLAAAQAGMSRVIVPARNMRDVLADVPPAVRGSLTIIPAERIEQVNNMACRKPAYHTRSSQRYQHSVARSMWPMQVMAAAFDPPLVLSNQQSKL
jgi:predicted ATP-dependent protease